MRQDTLRSNPDYHELIAHFADTCLILGQRLCEWCGHGPILEQDIAMSNLALDLLGEANNLYEYLAEIKGSEHTADSLAMLRSEREYKNLLLVELPNGHFGDTIARQFFFEAYHVLLLEQLLDVSDERLRGIAEKSLLEAKYHLRWASDWILRLGDGTEESHTKLKASIQRLIPYLGEMFMLSDYQERLVSSGYIPDSTVLKGPWAKQVRQILFEAGYEFDLEGGPQQKGGKQGLHTEYLGYILSELQYMQRAYPGLEW